MASDQKTTLEALETAVRMETDGKRYYLKASAGTQNASGRKLLASLAAEEDVHKQKFEEIYRAMKAKNAWPDVQFKPDGGKTLRTILARAEQTRLAVEDAEVEAVDTAIQMEVKTHDYYTQQAAAVPYPIAREFYQKLAAEEREHQLILVDYREDLKDPAGWFVAKEHPSLDGG